MEIDGKHIYFDQHELDALSRDGEELSPVVPLDAADRVLARAYERQIEVNDRDTSAIPHGSEQMKVVSWKFRTNQSLGSVIKGLGEVEFCSDQSADEFLRSLSAD